MSKLNTFYYIGYSYKPTKEEVLNKIKSGLYEHHKTKECELSYVAEEIFDHLYPCGVWDMIHEFDFDDEDLSVYIIIFEESSPEDFEVIRCKLEYKPTILFEDEILD